MLMKKIFILLMQLVPTMTFAGCSDVNDTIAIFYAKADDPSMGILTMRIIPIGKVTSDLGIFDEMESRLEFTFDNVQ